MSEIKELPGPWIQIYSLRDHLDTCAAHISQMFEVVFVMTQNKNGEVAGDISTEFKVQTRLRALLFLESETEFKPFIPIMFWESRALHHLPVCLVCESRVESLDKTREDERK